jgi:cob(I)alamin adenosyltransferase
MKIYTKTGDAGKTDLFGGKRLSKDELRIETYGTVDELNACIGLFRDHLTDEATRADLLTVQHRLFSIGSALASDPENPMLPLDLVEADLVFLESAIDRMDESLEPLRNFILPTGHPAISYAHLARTVCRRAERRAVALAGQESVDPLILRYLNRLSDYFFIAARYVAKLHRLPEVIWRSRNPPLTS